MNNEETKVAKTD